MAQVPQHQRARVMRDGGDLCHVRQRPAAVGHVGQADQGGRAVHGIAHRARRHASVHLGVDEAQVSAPLRRDPSQYITIRGEVIVIGHDDHPSGAGVQCGPGQFVQVDRGGVADQHLSRGSPKEMAA